MIERIGRSFLTANIENDEYSYVQEAGSKSSLEKAVGHTISHFKLDIRFQKEDTVVLVETKQNYVKSDEAQLSAYLEEEIALHKGMKIICILANTNDSSIKVWKNKVDDSSLLINETVLDTMEHYAGLFNASKQNDIFGIEIEDNAYGLATTNMLIHGDGNSNIKYDSCFKCKSFIKSANPDIILMNPPYNAKPIGIPEIYKTNWGKAKNGKEDPTKGLVFIHFLSDVIYEMNKERERVGKQKKQVKLAVLLPVSAAIGSSKIIENEKIAMLEENTLEAVFTLPNEVFYPGASVSACCMLFTLGKPHKSTDGFVNETFFGYCKEDGFKKKKNLGRVEQFDEQGNSKWKEIENNWLTLFRMKKSEDGLSATAVVDGKSEWLCEAYMKTDYSKLTEQDFQQTINNYLAYLVKEGIVYDS